MQAFSLKKPGLPFCLHYAANPRSKRFSKCSSWVSKGLFNIKGWIWGMYFLQIGGFSHLPLLPFTSVAIKVRKRPPALTGPLAVKKAKDPAEVKPLDQRPNLWLWTGGPGLRSRPRHPWNPSWRCSHLANALLMLIDSVQHRAWVKQWPIEHF